VPIREIDRWRAHLQRWPTVDFRRGRPLDGELKHHIMVQNCRGVLAGRIPGFVLIHEDGMVEYFGPGNSKSKNIIGCSAR